MGYAKKIVYCVIIVESTSTTNTLVPGSTRSDLVDEGVFVIAALGNEAKTRLDTALSSFETEDCGANVRASTGAPRS
jgi:hypothetical protein